MYDVNDIEVFINSTELHLWIFHIYKREQGYYVKVDCEYQTKFNCGKKGKRSLCKRCSWMRSELDRVSD